MFDSDYFQKPKSSDSRLSDSSLSDLQMLEPKLRERKPGALFEGVALTVAAIAFGCVTFADFLSHTVQPAAGPLGVAANGDQKSIRVTGLAPAKPPTQFGVDYSSTGSIGPLRQAPPVNPCEMKN